MLPVRRTCARRGARALLWGALSFVALQAALGAAVERWLAGPRDPEFAERLARLRGRLAEAPGKPLILVLGSSRVQTGLDAGRVRAEWGGRPALVFNFGVPGGGPRKQAVCLRRLLAAGVKPDFLVLDVLLPAFNRPRGRSVEEEWLDGARLTWEEVTLLRPYLTDGGRLPRQWAKGRALPFLTRQIAFAVEAGDPKRGMPPDDHGWSRVPLDRLEPEDRARRVAFARRQYATALGEFRPAEESARALGDTVDRCRAEGIPVGLLLMPEGESFRALYTPSMRDGLETCLTTFCRESGLPLVDARPWLGEDAFLDGHHLLSGGAAAFTERFEREGLPRFLETVRPH